MNLLPALEPFVVDGPPSAHAAKWKLWVERLENYFEAAAIDPDRRRPMFLHLGGPAVHKISKSVVEEGPPLSYQTLKRAITAYFQPLANPDYERLLLRQARQLPEELVDVFYARLRDLASTCTLPDPVDEIHVQFIPGCHSTKLRKHILQVPGLSMADMLTMGRSKELSRVRAAHMESALAKPIKAEPVNAVVAATPTKRKKESKSVDGGCTCYMCRGAYPHQVSFVPALLQNDGLDHGVPVQEGPSSESLMLPQHLQEPSGTLFQSDGTGAAERVAHKSIADPFPTDIVMKRGGDRYNLRPRL
ncbi:hypothetical protein NDU88_002841 [Pleurodeles waltl]|uniref:Retrotransposon gag domain-containing protein n=1 Tax=Pleurodeles waltl TaxID=8319 RepID=A0AAV7W570_PLEWA|nr:hypothetical protein NDU88_002841 [Pleurodeles waltl]